MPRPTKSTAIPRPDLGLVAYEYAFEAARRGFAGLRLLPYVPVGKSSGTIPIIPTSAFLKLAETRRAMGAGFSRSDFQFTDDNFNCEQHGHEAPVDDSEVAIFEGVYEGLDLDVIATKRVMQIMLLSQEKRIADLVQNTANYVANHVVGAAKPWDNLAESDPQADVEAGRLLIQQTTGLLPNTLELTYKMATKVLKSASFLEATKYVMSVATLPWDRKAAVLADYFDVPNLVIANAIYDKAPQGEPTSLESMWSDSKAILTVTPADPRDLKEPCLGRTLLFNTNIEGMDVEEYREEQTTSTIIRAKGYTDEKLMFTGCGYVITGLVTT